MVNLGITDEERTLDELEQVAAGMGLAFPFTPKYDRRTLYTDVLVPVTREMVTGCGVQVVGDAKWSKGSLRARARFGVAMFGGTGGSSMRVIEQYQIQYSVDGRVWGTAMPCYSADDGRDRMRAGFDEMMVLDLLVGISDGRWHDIRHGLIMEWWQQALEMAEEAHDIAWRV